MARLAIFTERYTIRRSVELTALTNFRIAANKELSLVKTCEKFKEAKDLCRELRASESPDNPNGIRMAFAETENKAKNLLAEKRQPSSPLEEWEA